MLKIVIADDDKIIRRGLRAIIERANGDFQVIGEAANGKQALEIVEKLEPDVLITDIKMPVMDGVELVKNAILLNAKLKVVVLSGFDEYKYVRETMKQGAIDYILKPIENEVLLQLLNKVSEGIEEERLKDMQTKVFSEKMSEGINALKERFLLELVKGGIDPSESYNRKLKEFGFDQGEGFLLAVVGIDDLYKTKIEEAAGVDIPALSTLRTYFEEALQDAVKLEGLVLSEQGSEIIALFISKDKNLEVFEQETHEYLGAVRGVCESGKAFTVTIGVGKVFNGLERTHIAYHQAIFALQRRFYEGKNRTIKYVREKCCYGSMKDGQLSNETLALLNFIELGDSQKVKRSVETILGKINEQNLEPDRFREIFSNIIGRVFAVSQDFKDITDVSDVNDFNIIYFIEELDTLSELKEYSLNAFYRITEKINIMRSEKSKKIIEMAKDYIKKHYNEGIGLKTVAEQVFLNPTYFSELFKNETGKNFIDYLIETKINIAKKLLANPEVKVYEVGQQVGYDEPVSFNRAFKKVVGVSPAEYRNLLK